MKNIGLKGKRKIADKWDRNSYVVKSQPIPDIPVYEVIPENPRARKTRLLHRILLLPFSSIFPRVNRRRSSSLSSDEPSNAQESQPSVLNLPPLVDIPDPSAEDSDGGYDASISSCSQPGDDVFFDVTTTVTVSYDGTYVIPMHRRPGQPGVKPRSATTITSSESSAESSQIRRPQRVRRKPPCPTVYHHIGQEKCRVLVEQVGHIRQRKVSEQCANHVKTCK